MGGFNARVMNILAIVAPIRAPLVLRSFCGGQGDPSNLAWHTWRWRRTFDHQLLPPPFDQQLPPARRLEPLGEQLLDPIWILLFARNCTQYCIQYCLQCIVCCARRPHPGHKFATDAGRVHVPLTDVFCVILIYLDHLRDLAGDDSSSLEWAPANRRLAKRDLGACNKTFF